MNKTTILGWVLLGGVGYFAASCGSDTKSNNAAAGGAQGDVGGSTSTSTSGGASAGGTSSTGGSAAVDERCEGAGADPERVDGGLVQIAGSDPSYSLALDVGGFYAHGDYKGYCFTYADNKPEGSTIFPPCGNEPDCFTKDSGLCVKASLGMATADIWGAGIGCSLNEDQETGKSGGPVNVAGVTSISVEIYGCSTPKSVRVQLNVDPPIYDVETDKLHSGYYCADLALSDPDANGVRKGTLEVAKLKEDCWTGTGLAIDTTTQTVKSVQMQVNADSAKKVEYDFCVSKFALE